jgi:tetratricopeptide (TPR) repeat protein
MARKRPAKPAPKITPDHVAKAVRAGDFVTAEHLALSLMLAEPANDAHAALLRTTLLQAAEHFDAHAQPADLKRVLDAAVRLNHHEPAWVRAVGELLARAGRRSEGDLLAAPLNDPTFTAKLNAHHADWLVRTRNHSQVPDDWRAGYDAVTTAFLHYHAGKDDPAREALNAIGLSSPFLEWKLLLRGLIAWSTNDDAKAVENISRLNPTRYPARLAAPVRVQIDAAFAQSQPPAVKAKLAEQGQRLRAVGLVAKLAKVRGELARSRKLGPAFKAAEPVVSELKKAAPHLLPKLADAFYFAIAKRGEPTDLPKHTKLFGPPPADPAFHKLEAMVLEEINDLEISLQKWAAFEGWLAGVPAGWSGPLAERARAVLLKRMAGLAADIEADAADPRAIDAFGGFFGAPARKPKEKRKPVDPTVYLKRAADLAPDWEPVAQELFNTAVDRGDFTAAEAAARRFLEHNPQSMPVLSALASLKGTQGDTAEALGLRRRALAVNPLDAANRHLVGAATVAHARNLAVGGGLADAETLLEESRPLLEEKLPTSYFALRAVLHRKAKRPAEADTAAEAALRQKTSRLVARLYLHANAVLLKLKPKEKAAAAKELADALEPVPTPGEAASLLTGYDMYLGEGLKYTGQKTQEKKILEAVMRAVDSPEGAEVEFEAVAGLLQNRRQFAQALKAAAALARRFPKNPLFPLVLAQAELGKSKGRAGYKVTEPLRKAKALAEASTEERHKQLLPQIDDLLKASDPFGGLFGGFFG